MHPIALFITDLNNNKDKNIKKHHKLMAAVLWQFGLKVAEKFFIYNEDAQAYAQKVLFLELDNSIDYMMEQIQKDFTLHDIPYIETEIYDLFILCYNKSYDEMVYCNNIDFYI